MALTLEWCPMHGELLEATVAGGAQLGVHTDGLTCLDCGLDAVLEAARQTCVGGVVGQERESGLADGRRGG
jgi:hypothetical protein